MPTRSQALRARSSHDAALSPSPRPSDASWASSESSAASAKPASTPDRIAADMSGAVDRMSSAATVRKRYESLSQSTLDSSGGGGDRGEAAAGDDASPLAARRRVGVAYGDSKGSREVALSKMSNDGR